MLLPNSFTKVFKDGLWCVYNKYTVNLDPDFIGTEQECDEFITQEYKLENEMDKIMGEWG
jgi:hypothetical protein